MPFRYRCKRRTKGVQCDTRISLPKPLSEYVRPPVCKGCGKPLSYRDRNSGPRHKREVCHCSGLHHPHTRRSKWCDHYKGEYTPEEIEDAYRGNSSY